MNKLLPKFTNKAFWIFVFSTLSLALMMISAFTATIIFPDWHSLAAGLILMLIAIPFHVFGKQKPLRYMASFAINSVACGCSAAAYYIEKNIPFDLGTAAFALLPAAAVLLLAFLCLKLFGKKTVSITASVVLDLLLLGGSIVLWVRTNRLLGSMSVFALIIALFFLGVIAVSVGHSERNLLRDISFGSFGSFIILTVVVAVLLSEGDAFDFSPDVDLDQSGKRKSKSSGKHL